MTASSSSRDMVLVRTRGGARSAAFLVMSLFLLVLYLEVVQPDSFSPYRALLVSLLGLPAIGALSGTSHSSGSGNPGHPEQRGSVDAYFREHDEAQDIY